MNTDLNLWYCYHRDQVYLGTVMLIVAQEPFKLVGDESESKLEAQLLMW